MKSLFALCLFSMTALLGGSLRIINDSPFPLNAEIIASDGSYKGKLFLVPQQQTTWKDSSPDAAVWSQTPYTVIFTCKSGKQFGVLSGAQQGATVTALLSSGDRYCEPPKKKQNHQESSQKDNRTSPAPSSSPDSSSSPGDPIWGPPGGG